METVADYVSPLVMAHDVHLYPGSRIVLGNYGWYDGFWAARLVGWLPRGDQLSSVLPMLITIAMFGGLAAQARRLWNTTAAVALVAFGLAAGGPSPARRCWPPSPAAGWLRGSRSAPWPS